MKRFISLVSALIFASLAQVALADTICVADVSGAQENPPVDSAASGLAVLVLNADATAVTVIASVFNLPNITASHIHRGAVGVNGPVIFGIGADYSTLPQIRVWDTINADDVTNLLNGGLYFNAHTPENPGGEIRGQISCLK